MKACLPDWTATDATHSCMLGCESVLAVNSKQADLLCVDFIYVVSEDESLMSGGF